MASYNSGPIVFKVTTEGLVQAAAAAQSINNNMTGAAAAAGKMGKAAAGALNQSKAGLFSENREYGQARGVTGMTGASGRDFAKQAEGLGGLVRLYATFAANIFAVSMAFEALKRSFQFEQLQRASDAFAVTTGKNLSYVAQQMKELSQGALTDKAAQSYANYGASAGFTADQMKRLVVVAKGASQALGRDMGDSIDRLIRGTGKLEPELLDELGLLTRTKQAGVEYGKAIGKTFEQLTQFEKTQAFVNAVLKEGEQKFGAVAAAVNVSPFERLQAAVVNAGTAILNILNKLIAPLAGFLANNSGALYAGIIAAVLYLAKTALPMLTASAEQERAAQAKNLDTSLKYYTTRAEYAKKSADFQIAEMKRLHDTLNDYAKSEGQEVKTQMAKLKAGAGPVSTAARNFKGDPASFVDKAKVNNGMGVLAYTNAEIDKLEKKIASLDTTTKRGRDSFDTYTRQLERHTTVSAALIAMVENQKSAIDRKAVATENSIKLTKLEAEAKETQLGIERSYSQSRLTTAKIEGLSNISQAAQLAGLKAAWAAYKTELSAVNFAKEEANKTATKYTATLNNLGVAFWKMQAGVSGAIGLITGFASAINTAFFVIGTLVAAFQVLISITGGVNKSYDALISSQEAFSAVLKNSDAQAIKFIELQRSVDGTAVSFLKLKEYSSNSLSGIADGLRDVSTAFKAFIQDSGWWTSLKDNFSKLWDGDVATKQVENLRKSIFAALGTVSAEDRGLVEKAIINAIPNASSVNDALAKISQASGAILSVYSQNLAKAFASIDISLKNNVASLKMGTEAWKALGQEVDKVEKKDEVKDSKYRAVVEALKSINSQYKLASSEIEKQNVLAALSVSELEKILEFGKKHKMDMTDLVRLYGEATTKLRERAELERKNAAEKTVESQRAAGNIIGLEGVAEINKKMQQFEADKREFEKAVARGSVGAADAQLTNMKRSQAEMAELYTKLSKKAGFENNPGAKKELEESGITAVKYMSAGILQAEGTFTSAVGTLAGKAGAAIQNAFSKMGPVTLPFAKLFPDNSPTEQEEELAHHKDVTRQRAISKTPDLIPTDKLANEKKEQGAKLSKMYDMEIKQAQSYLALLKERSNIQKELIGYVGEELTAALAMAELAVAQKNYDKDSAQLDLEAAKRIGDISKIKETEAQLAEKARMALIDELQNKQDLLEINKINLDIDREKSKLEQNYYAFLERSLSLQIEINKYKKEFGLISELDSTVNSTNIKAAQDLLAIEKERSSIALLVKKSQDIINSDNIGGERKAAAAIDLKYAQEQLAINEKLRTYKEQQVKLEQSLTIELAKQKQYWDQMAAVGEALSSIVEFQLSTQSSIIGYSQVSLANAQQEAILVMQSTKALREKLTLLGLSLDSEEGQIIALSEQLKITQQIYDNRRKIWELAAQDDSGADFGKTLAQGFQYALEDFRKNMKSAITTIIDGTMAGIDASVDYIIKNLKDGTQSTLKGMAKAFGQTAKDVLISYIGDKVKLAMKQILVGMFEDKSNSIEEINKRVAESMDIANKTLGQVDATNKQLIDALRSLEDAVRQSASNAGKTDLVPGFSSAGQMDQDLADMSVSTKTLIADIDNSADSFDSLGYASLNTSEAVTMAGSSMVNSAGAFAKVVGFSLSSIKSALGSFGGKIGGAAGAAIDGLSGMTNMFGSVLSIGTNATTAIGMLGSASSWAAGAATSFAGSAMGTSLGLSQAGALIEGGMVTALDAALPAISAAGEAFIGLAAAMPYVAAFVAVAYAAYKIFGGNKGGPKLQGYGGAGVDESGNVVASDTVGPNDRGFQSTNAGKEMAEVWSKGVMQNTKDFMIGIGRTLAQDVKVGFGFQMDNPKGDAPTEGNAIVKKNGQVMYTSDTGSAPKGDDEAWQKWLAEEAGRTMLASLKAQDDLPKNVANYFETIAWDSIKTLKPEEVSQKLDFAKVLAYIDTNNDKLTKIFGESIYDITESGLKALQVTGETYTQTMERLTTTFEMTNKAAKILGVKIEDAFGKVGLAGYEMRNKLIKAVGGLEAFNAKFTFFYENFYSEAQRGAMAMEDAQTTLADSFTAMGYPIPRTREEFNTLMSTFLAMGDSGQTLVAQLLEVAPAFDYVHDAIEGALGAIESALTNIQNQAKDFREQILDDTQSDEERWNRIKGQVDSNIDALDTISSISDSDLANMSVADITKKTTEVEKNTTDAIAGVQKLWNTLSEDEKKIRGPEFIKWIDTIESNSALILARLGAAAEAKADIDPTTGKPKVPEAGAQPLTTDQLLENLPTSLSTALDESFSKGATLIGTSISQALTTAMSQTGGIGSLMNSSGMLPVGSEIPSAEVPENTDLAIQTMDTINRIRESAKADQEALFGQQKAAIDDMAAKLLDVARAMADAAAGQQSAAGEFKQAAGAIPSKFEIKVSQEDASNSVGLK